MPKQLTDVELKIVNAGRELLFSEGFSAFSMRLVAYKAGIAVGTIYNYVKNKNELIAKVALVDWYATLSAIADGLSKQDGFENGVVFIYKNIAEFRSKYYPLFEHYSSGSQDSVKSLDFFHPQLRASIDKYIGMLLPDANEEVKNNIIPLLSELVLACATHEDLGEDKLRSLLNSLNI